MLSKYSSDNHELDLSSLDEIASVVNHKNRELIREQELYNEVKNELDKCVEEQRRVKADCEVIAARTEITKQKYHHLVQAKERMQERILRTKREIQTEKERAANKEQELEETVEEMSRIKEKCFAKFDSFKAKYPTEMEREVPEYERKIFLLRQRKMELELELVSTKKELGQRLSGEWSRWRKLTVELAEVFVARDKAEKEERKKRAESERELAAKKVRQLQAASPFRNREMSGGDGDVQRRFSSHYNISNFSSVGSRTVIERREENTERPITDKEEEEVSPQLAPLINFSFKLRSLSLSNLKVPQLRKITVDGDGSAKRWKSQEEVDGKDSTEADGAPPTLPIMPQTRSEYQPRDPHHSDAVVTQTPCSTNQGAIGTHSGTSVATDSEVKKNLFQAAMQEKETPPPIKESKLPNARGGALRNITNILSSVKSLMKRTDNKPESPSKDQPTSLGGVHSEKENSRSLNRREESMEVEQSSTVTPWTRLCSRSLEGLNGDVTASSFRPALPQDAGGTTPSSDIGGDNLHRPSGVSNERVAPTTFLPRDINSACKQTSELDQNENLAQRKTKTGNGGLLGDFSGSAAAIADIAFGGSTFPPQLTPPNSCGRDDSIEKTPDDSTISLLLRNEKNLEAVSGSKFALGETVRGIGLQPTRQQSSSSGLEASSPTRQQFDDSFDDLHSSPPVGHNSGQQNSTHNFWSLFGSPTDSSGQSPVAAEGGANFSLFGSSEVKGTEPPLGGGGFSFNFGCPTSPEVPENDFFSVFNRGASEIGEESTINHQSFKLF